jgi:hypothetical protein
VRRLGHRREGSGGLEGRITLQYAITRPGQNITLFTRTMTVEGPNDAPMPHAANARELESVAAAG